MFPFDILGKVVYHVGHYGYITRFIVHKLKYYPKDDVSFLVDTAKMPYECIEYIMGNLSKLGKVVLYSEFIFYHKNTKS